jgi:hypothetical protein
MTKRSWLGYIAAYLMWVIVLALGIWFLLVSRTGFLSALAAYHNTETVSGVWQVRLLDQVYSVTVGLIWLVLMTVTERYFRKGVRRGVLLTRFATIVGPEILLILVADLFLLWLQGGSRVWSRWLILGSELVIGAGLVLFARYSRTRKPDEITSVQ